MAEAAASGAGDLSKLSGDAVARPVRFVDLSRSDAVEVDIDISEVLE